MNEVVDPLVGPVSSAATGGGPGSYMDRGGAHDFSIGALGFRIASTDETPYVRTTTQFRKDQYDASPTVGDQSLLGWWTRGQMSFHKGAGVKYYETLDGAEVLDRFQFSSGVDVHEAGQVTIAPRRKEVAVPSGLAQCVHVTDFSTNEVLCLAASGGLTAITAAFFWESSTTRSVATSDGAAATSLAASPFRAFLTNGTKIETFVPGDVTTTVLWTSTDGRTLTNVFYAKSRLWVVDSTGQWYMLTTAGGSFTVAADGFTTSPMGALYNGARTWSLAEVPTGVVVTNRYSNAAYLITVEDVSGVPTPGALLEILKLPQSEYPYQVGYQLGYLVLATNGGVRVAALAGTQAVYGPQIIRGDFKSCRGITADNTLTMVVGEDRDGNAGVWALDLATEVADLQPAHTLRYPLASLGTEAGVLSSALGTVIWNSDESFTYRAWDAGEQVYGLTGELTTGFHRFGTLEPKYFHSIRLRVGGTGGTITVSRIDQDGTVTSLLTVDPTGFSDDPITLRLDSPVEMVGLKFTLTRHPSDQTKYPILLGYQLRAQPAPVRQRTLKVPLLVQDTERNRFGVNRGRPGRAWEQLNALEQLESDHAIVGFRDYRTGEAGQAYIDEIEFRGDTPVVRQDGGFGGVAYVTLRKVT